MDAVHRLGVLSFLLVWAASAHSCYADLITNPSYENTAGTFVPGGSTGVMNLPVGSTVIPGWTVINNPILWVANGNPFGPTTPYGTMFLDLTGLQDNSAFGGVTQTIATTPGQQYRFSLSLGESTSLNAYWGPMSVLVTAGSSSQSFTYAPAVHGNQWGEFDFDFVATSTSTPLSIVGTASGGGQYLGLDHVSVTQVTQVPEPSALVLALGAFVLMIVAAGVAGPGSRVRATSERSPRG